MTTKTEFKEPLFDGKSNHLRHNVNFLRAPMARPARKLTSEYVIESGHGTTTVMTQGILSDRLPDAGLPTAHQWKILNALLSKARYDGKASWKVRLRSGKALYDVMGVKREFNSAEARRVEEAILRLMDLKLIFNGTWYCKQAKSNVRGKRMFHVIDFAEVKKVEATGNWWITVEFNSHFMEEMLYGLTTTYHLPTLMKIKSPMGIALFKYLNAAIAFNQSGDVDIAWKRLCQYLGVDEHGRMRTKEFKDRISMALDEINQATATLGYGYTTVWVSDAKVKFIRWTKAEFEEIGLNFPPTSNRRVSNVKP